jgi:hypothetical protein
VCHDTPLLEALSTVVHWEPEVADALPQLLLLTS